MIKNAGSCIPEGLIKLVVLWLYLQYRGNVLKIHSVKKEDRGTYYCVADNGVGKPAQRNVAVEVEFPPSVEYGGGGGDVGQAMGYSAELVCHVEAYPRPTITWIHEGIQLSTNQVRGILKFLKWKSV